MEVLPRLVRFPLLSNCPQKHNLVLEKGEKLIAIENTQSPWREAKPGSGEKKKTAIKGVWKRFLLIEVFMTRVPNSSQ